MSVIVENAEGSRSMQLENRGADAVILSPRGSDLQSKRQTMAEDAAEGIKAWPPSGSPYAESGTDLVSVVRFD